MDEFNIQRPISHRNQGLQLIYGLLQNSSSSVAGVAWLGCSMQHLGNPLMTGNSCSCMLTLECSKQHSCDGDRRHLHLLHVSKWQSWEVQGCLCPMPGFSTRCHTPQLGDITPGQCCGIAAYRQPLVLQSVCLVVSDCAATHRLQSSAACQLIQALELPSHCCLLSDMHCQMQHHDKRICSDTCRWYLNCVIHCQ